MDTAIATIILYSSLLLAPPPAIILGRRTYATPIRGSIISKQCFCLCNPCIINTVTDADQPYQM